MKASLWVILSCFILAACATRPAPPIEEMGAARSAIDSAADAGARDWAAVEFQRAQQLLSQAEQALEQNNHGEARHLAREARLEARYAATRARSERSARMIGELEQSINDLRAEIHSARIEQRDGGRP